MPPVDPGHVAYRNHILVGLGGTGGTVIREFRREMTIRHGDATPPGLRVDYLYVDSSEADLNNESNWKVLGKSFHLPQSSRLSINVPDLRAIVNNAPAYPGIAPWMGSRQLWTEYLQALAGMKAAGGQRRRLGRLLFAHNVKQFNDTISMLYNRVTSGGEKGAAGSSGVTFHLICGLAGGTGSGSIVDAAAQIGRFISERKAEFSDRIIIYGYLPEENPPAKKNEKYYIPNGYAALLELNALSAGRYLPFDVSGRRHFREGEFMPFNGCYVYTNQTNSGSTFHPDDMPEMLSAFLYQKIVAVGDAGAWGTLVRAENSENGIPDCEPRSTEAGRKPAPERSVRFMTFGIKRIAVPEAEIQEHLTFGYGVEALRQFLFNNWSPQFGFSDTVRNSDFRSFREDGKMAVFRASWDHLLLYRPILSSDERYDWKPSEEYWRDFVGMMLEDVVTSVDKRFWLEELRNLGRSQFDGDYRIDGAIRFYQQKEATIANEVSEIRRVFETHLLRSLLEGQLSLTEITGSKRDDLSFDGIIEVVKAELKDRESRAVQKAESARKLVKEIDTVLDEIQTEYSRVWMIDPFNKRARLLEEFKQALSDYLTQKVDALAYDYASKLCPLVVTELDQLFEEATILQAAITNLFEEFKSARDKRCTEDETPDYGRPSVKYYNAPVIRKHLATVRKESSLMESLCASVRARMVEELGFDLEPPRFKTFNAKLANTNLEPLLEQVCTRSSRNDHDIKFPTSDVRLLGVDLVPRLLREFPTAEKQAAFSKQIMVQATNLAPLDETEKGNVTANPDPNSIVRKSMSVLAKGLIHTPEDPKPEIRTLTHALTQAPPSGSGEVDFVETPDQSNSMVVVSLTNILPLRVLRRTSFLRSRYEQLLGNSSTDKLDALFLHGEGDGSQFPGLFAITMSEIRDQGHRLLLLAVASGTIIHVPDAPADRRLVFEVKDPDGVVTDFVSLGADYTSAIERLTPELFVKISSMSETSARGMEFDALKANLAAQMRSIQASKDLVPSDSDSFRAAYKMILEEFGTP